MAYTPDEIYQRAMSLAYAPLNINNLRSCPGCGEPGYPSDLGLYQDAYGSHIPVCHTCGPILEQKAGGDAKFLPDFFEDWETMEWCEGCGMMVERDNPCHPTKEDRHGDLYCGKCCREGGLTDGIKCHVNVYLEDRAYGGPEEGGWWFDYGELIKVIPVTESVCPALVMLDMMRTYDNEGRSPKWSVNSDGEYRVVCELLAGKNWPEETPRYE